MPEYHQVQLFVDTGTLDLDTVKARFTGVLLALGWTEPGAHAWLDGLVWEEADDGFVYFDNAPGRLWVGDGVELNVRPGLLGWTPRTMPALARPWIEHTLLFHSDELQDPDAFPRYAAPALRRVVEAIRICRRAFPEVAVYLTDETQDGEPFSGFVEGDEAALWCFDLALVPDTLAARYRTPPPGYTARSTPDGLMLFNANVSDLV